MPALTDTFTLSNDVTIPKIGFGTWQIPDGAETYDSVRAALDAGYRHIDTARAYGNEASVGRAVRGLAQRGRVDVTLDRLEVLGAGEGGPVVVSLGHGVLSPASQRPP